MCYPDLQIELKDMESGNLIKSTVRRYSEVLLFLACFI